MNRLIERSGTLTALATRTLFVELATCDLRSDMFDADLHMSYFCFGVGDVRSVPALTPFSRARSSRYVRGSGNFSDHRESELSK